MSFEPCLPPGAQPGPDSNPAKSFVSSVCRVQFFYVYLGFPAYKMGLKVIPMTSWEDCWGGWNE